MKHLTANTTPADRARATRLLLAWLAGDKYALNVVLDEVMADPTGTPGLIFALTDFTARLGHEYAPDFAGQLRASLLGLEDDEGGRG